MKAFRKITALVLVMLLAVCCTFISNAANGDNGPIKAATLSQWANSLTNNEQYFMFEYLEGQSGWTKGYDLIAQAPYLYNQSKGYVASYESQTSLKAKSRYIDNKGLAGLIVWDSQGDNMNTYPMFSSMKTQIKDKGKNVIAYYGSWESYGEDAGGRTQGQNIDQVAWDKISILNYAFYEISNGTTTQGAPKPVDKYKIRTTDYGVDFGANTYAKCLPYGGDNSPDDLPYWGKDQFYLLSQKKAQNPGVKAMLSVGGWTRSNMFHEMCLTQASRTIFINSCVQFLKDFTYFDGIDLDWEYPGVYRPAVPASGDLGNPAGPEDKANFTLLISELRAALDANFTGSNRKLLTSCFAADPAKLVNVDLAAVSTGLDYMNLMTYDYYGSWGSSPFGHNSPLYGATSTEWCADNTVNTVLAAGVSPSKINIGSPLYGYIYKNVTADGNGNPRNMPNPLAKRLMGTNMSVAMGASKSLDVKYEFFDGSFRTPVEVHNPVNATATSGAGNVQLVTDPITGEITVKGLAVGTANLSVTDPATGFSTTLTVTVTGGSPLSLTNITLTGALKTRTSIAFTPVVSGGSTPYKFNYMVTKGSRLCYIASDVTAASFAYAPMTSGDYTVKVVCTDNLGASVSFSKTFTITV